MTETRTTANQPTTESAALFTRAERVIPGGVNSPVRAFRAVGGTPRFITSATGAWLRDADGNAAVHSVARDGTDLRRHFDGPHPVRSVTCDGDRAVAGDVVVAWDADAAAVVGISVGSRSLLAIDPVRRALNDAFDQRLRPVLEHDADRGTALRESLLAYLEANGNWGVAAAAQGVHRHTLRHRIERIEDMLAVDLSDARTRAELLLMLLGASA